jgi:hypothetical protein
MQTLNGTRAISIPKTVESIRMSFVHRIPEPYMGASTGGLFYKTGFCRESFLCNMADFEKVFIKGF